MTYGALKQKCAQVRAESAAIGWRMTILRMEPQQPNPVLSTDQPESAQNWLSCRGAESL